ncbi:MAG TPA: 2-amino-4-hydroxy-6-hydroxymethyldihydropteridine diphosphokinase [Caulobacteraceae bacterium]
MNTARKASLDEIGVVALGSNQPGEFDSSRDLLDAAVAALPGAGFNVVRTSRWWRSRAWPEPTHPDYLNGVVLVETGLDPRTSMEALKSLEARFGRVRSLPNAPRTLDLDLIALGRTVMDRQDLVLPHPRAHLRRFVMAPLAEIAPEWRHPVLGSSARELARDAQIGADVAPE